MYGKTIKPFPSLSVSLKSELVLLIAIMDFLITKFLILLVIQLKIILKGLSFRISIIIILIVS